MLCTSRAPPPCSSQEAAAGSTVRHGAVPYPGAEQGGGALQSTAIHRSSLLLLMVAVSRPVVDVSTREIKTGLLWRGNGEILALPKLLRGPEKRNRNGGRRSARVIVFAQCYITCR